MHPLKDSGSLTKVRSGRWEKVQRADQLTEIKLVRHTDRAQREGISSIPSPWARLQLFRDAIRDPEHPSHEDVVNDILDAIELVFFQNWIHGLRLNSRRIDLSSLHQRAKAEHKPGVERFVAALRELAPDVPDQGSLSSLTMVFHDERLLFATSPFTLVFTPEVAWPDIPGYFVRNRSIRPLSERPPLLADYVRRSLLPQLGNASGGALAELQSLRGLLERQLEKFPGAHDASSSGFVQTELHPAVGISLHRAERITLKSDLELKPTRSIVGIASMPLVLDNSGVPLQRQYFPWLSRPADATVEASLDRNVLPGTCWTYGWINPELDFLSEKLIILDAPLHSERVHTTPDSSQGLANRILLPLNAKFFEYFKAEDVSKMLKIRTTAGNEPVVHVELTVPTAGGEVTVKKEYKNSMRLGVSISLWPGFKSDDEPKWTDYYAALYVEGEDVSETIDMRVGDAGALLSSQQFQRDLSTLVHHFDRAPECLFITARTRTVGDARLAQGVLLPKMRQAPPATKPAWVVAIDFGTSNTVVAYREGTSTDTLEVSNATRFDLTHAADDLSHAGAVFDTFFYPPTLDARPFGTLMFRSQSADAASPLAQIPAVTANVPFSGDVSAGAAAPGSRHANEIVGDLKWGGGGADGERLTKLFLHQVLQLVHAEARARGVRTDGMSVKWSYPSAFSRRKFGISSTQWESTIAEFERTRLGAPEGEQQREIESLDESTAAMLYLRTDPAGHGSFGPNTRFIKLTADVGGGTCDVAAYANGGIVFRNSILFGGRDLLTEPVAGGADAGTFAKIYQWAISRQIPYPLRRVIDAYPSHHTKFTYLVRHRWFDEKRGALSGEPWFPAVQACILYFYGAILYNIGIRLRNATSDDGVRPPDLIFFGGNGSSYLNWLTEFQSWNRAGARPAFTKFFQSILEEGYGKELGAPLEILTTSKPKHEVALGLLEPETAIVASNVQLEAPVGEGVFFQQTGGSEAASYGAEDTLPSASLPSTAIPHLRYTKKFNDREISRYNRIFVSAMSGLATSVDPQWREMARQVSEALSQLDERLYENQIANTLEEHLKRDDIGAVTLFILEARTTLRHLEHHIVGNA
jgi:hypothetical protein